MPTPDADPPPRPEDATALRAPLPASLGAGTPASPRLVVDVLLGVPITSGWRLLMLRRTPQQGGFWQGVSGRVESFDAHLEAAARREIREETGYEASEVIDLGRWVTFISPLTGRSFKKRCLGALLPPNAGPATIVLSDEHAEARLTTLDEALSLLRFPENRIELETFRAWLSGRAPRV
jgi:8-oxo-dGTP pyrophosphatase MutT (NUDIX family)